MDTIVESASNIKWRNALGMGALMTEDHRFIDSMGIELRLRVREMTESKVACWLLSERYRR